MKKINLFFIVLLCFISINICASETVVPDYFKILQTEKKTSSDIVEWTQIGPGMAGYCEQFWCHPTDEKALFMSPDMYNSYGSWDGGKSWETIKDCDGNGSLMRRVQAMAFSHQHPNLGYALDVRGYLFKTTDKGHSWVKIKEMGGKLSAISVDPTDDNIWYIGAGDFWNVKSNHRTQESLDDPTKGYFYKYAQYGFIMKSTDGGETWVKKTNGFPANTSLGNGVTAGIEVGDIIIDPLDNNIVIVNTNYGVFRSEDQGETWTKSVIGLDNYLVRDITYQMSEDYGFILYAIDQTSYSVDDNKNVSSKGGVYYSDDAGKTWKKRNENLKVDINSINNYFIKEYYYNTLSAWLGVDKSIVKGYNLPSNILSTYNHLEADPKNIGTLYLSGNVNHDKGFMPGVWKSQDAGKTWNPVLRSGVLWSNSWLKVKYSEYEENNVSLGHMKPSMDLAVAGGIRYLSVGPTGNIYSCLDQQSLISENGGDSWIEGDDFETLQGSNAWIGRGDSNLPGRFILMDTGVKNRYLLCSGEHGLWKTVSLDDFSDKKVVPVTQIEGQCNPNYKDENGVLHTAPHSIASVAVDPKDPDIIYTVQFRQDHRDDLRGSKDGGKTWYTVCEDAVPCASTNLSSDNVYKYNLTVDPVNTNNIYFVVMEYAMGEVGESKHLSEDIFDGYGVWRSQDKGLHWSNVTKGKLPDGISVRRLKMDNNDPNILYAACNISSENKEGGLYKSIDKGETWNAMNIPAEIKSVNNFFQDQNNNMFISCGTYTGSFKEGGVWKSSDNGQSWSKIFFMPYCWQTEVSKVNPNIITVAVACQKENNAYFNTIDVNPGAYVSFDGGESWNKINKNLGQPDVIVDLKPDAYNQDVFWCALKGSGWSVGYVKGAKTSWDGKQITALDDVKYLDNSGVFNVFFDKNNLNLNLYSSLNCFSQIDIYDLSGVLVGSKEFKLNKGNNDVKYNIKNLKQGMYIVCSRSQGGEKMSKFLVK